MAHRFLVFAVAIAACAQTDDGPGQLLRNASRQIMDTVQRLPNYVCTETIARYRYQPDEVQSPRRTCDDMAADIHSGKWKQHLSYSDRLRFDVAVNHDPSAPDGEMYSWAGAGRFSNRDIFEMVDGAMSTGSFSSMLASIFGGHAARFSYDGDVSEGEKTLAEFGFRVPEEESAYYYVFGKGRTNQARVPYNGTFLIDAATRDLARLVVRTGTLPAESRACELTRTVSYGRTHLHEADFLLPVEARVSLVHTDGTIAENVITYSGCREFHGEATVRFEQKPEMSPEGHAVTSSPQTQSLPAGLPFTLTLTQPVDPATAAAGDAFQARLKTPIRTRSKVLVPEGAVVMGRIVSIRRYYQPPASSSREARKNKTEHASLVIAVKLESVEISGARLPLKAGPDTGLHRFVKLTGSLSARVDMGPMDQLEDSDTAIFEVWGANADDGLKSGLESNWRTLEPRPGTQISSLP
jgi:hypothetical protein